MSVNKIQPNIKPAWSDGNDGRDGYWYVQYTCPTCGKRLSKGDIACDSCGTFFDWSREARIQVRRTAEWE